VHPRNVVLPGATPLQKDDVDERLTCADHSGEVKNVIDVYVADERGQTL